MSLVFLEPWEQGTSVRACVWTGWIFFFSKQQVMYKKENPAGGDLECVEYKSWLHLTV